MKTLWITGHSSTLHFRRNQNVCKSCPELQTKVSIQLTWQRRHFNFCSRNGLSIHLPSSYKKKFSTENHATLARVNRFRQGRTILIQTKTFKSKCQKSAKQTKSFSPIFWVSRTQFEQKPEKMKFNLQQEVSKPVHKERQKFLFYHPVFAVEKTSKFTSAWKSPYIIGKWRGIKIEGENFKKDKNIQ